MRLCRRQLYLLALYSNCCWGFSSISISVVELQTFSEYSMTPFILLHIEFKLIYLEDEKHRCLFRMHSFLYSCVQLSAYFVSSESIHNFFDVTELLFILNAILDCSSLSACLILFFQKSHNGLMIFDICFYFQQNPVLYCYHIMPTAMK